jgi:transposase, IS5 family
MSVWLSSPGIAGIDLAVKMVPDETMILDFQHFLEKHNLTSNIFEKTICYLADKVVLLRGRTIADATIITAPSSTKDREKTRDKEMRSTRKGNQYYLGMKAHVGTDAGKGLAHSVVVTDASVHNSQAMDELVQGEEQVVYGDKAYAKDKKQQEYESKGIKSCANGRGSRYY